MTGTWLFAALVWSAMSVGCGSSAADPAKPLAIQPGDPAYQRNPALDVSNISKRGETKSHNLGQNCMGCHQAKGPGKGRYTVAGTLYDEVTREPVPNGTLELRDGKGADAKLVLSVEVDGLGNFFSTESLPLPEQALFPSVRSADGLKVNAMPFPSISGACNQCHVRGNLVDVAEPPPK